MSTPQFYSWDDDGSPGRALTGNLQNRLKQILVPCLVTGYGSKPGAGWTLEHEHANGFTLSNGDAYVNFVSNLPASAPYPAMNADSVHIYVAESLTDSSQAIIDGANLCSGTYRKGAPELVGFPRHMIGNARNALNVELSSLQWTLVADDRTLILNFSSNGSAGNLNQQYSLTLYAGEALLDSDVSGNFIVLSGGIGAYDIWVNMRAFGLGYSAPRDLSTGLNRLVLVESEPYTSTFNIDPVGVINSAPARLNFQQPRLLFAGQYVGLLRGVVYDDVLRSLYGWQVALKALGFSGDDFTDRGKSVKIGDYNYAYARSASGSSFLTDNPAFW